MSPYYEINISKVKKKRKLQKDSTQEVNTHIGILVNSCWQWYNHDKLLVCKRLLMKQGSHDRKFSKITRQDKFLLVP